MKLPWVPVGVLVIVGLTGCVAPAADPVASPSPTTSATSSASATPTPTPAPVGPPTLDELVIADGGVSGFVIGSDPNAQFPATAFMAQTGTECLGEPAAYWEDIYAEKPEGAAWTVTIQAVLDEGLVAALAVYGPGPHTESGIAVGSTRADLIAAYPDAELVITHVGRDRYAIDFGSWVLTVDVVAPGGEVTNGGVPADQIVSLMIIPSMEFVGRPSFHTLAC